MLKIRQPATFSNRRLLMSAKWDTRNSGGWCEYKIDNQGSPKKL